MVNNYWMSLNLILKIMQNEVDNSLRDLRNTSYHSVKAEFNNCFIIHSKYFQALNKPSVLIDFFKTFAWFSAQLENMNSYYFSKRRWHSLSNSFYVSCLLIFFCSVLVIYSAISSVDSCRPAAQLFRHMLKKATVTHRCHGTRLRYTIVSIGANQNEICKLVT